jgi:hypothetical protein
VRHESRGSIIPDTRRLSILIIGSGAACARRTQA